MSLDNIILRLEKVIETLEVKKSSSSTVSGVVQVDHNPTTLLKKAHNVIDEAIKVLEIEKRKD
tara:strand:- start:233 stop:421 length:189 start_codon:yes stop_codon:yes gene_type:complete